MHLNLDIRLKENCHHVLTYPKNLIKHEKHGEKMLVKSDFNYKMKKKVISNPSTIL